MNLIVLRHGEAGKRMMITGRDAERALTVSGREEVEDVAESLRDMDLKFDSILASPLKRCSETAEIVAKVLKLQKKLELWDELKPEGDARAFYRRLSKMKNDSSVLVVGHEPYLSSMISQLISGKEGAHIALKKAGLARIELTAMLPIPSGELRWLLTPRLAKRVS
jgi:phosphohistidine phosphatase